MDNKEIKKEEKDKCVVCWCDTVYNKDTPIEDREHYVEGVGQLCEKCFNEIYVLKKDK